MSISIETKYMDSIYFESSELNEILISDTANVSLGTISSITTNKIIKTGGLPLLTNLEAGQAIKVNNEVKRVDYIEDDNTFYVTRNFKETHLVGDTIYKDFSNNITITTSSVGSVYSLSNDSFENQVAISDLIGGVLSINRCTEMTNASSLFIFDDSENISEREESFITGTYNLEDGDVSNLVNPFLAKVGKSLYFIIDMEEIVDDLDENGEIEVTDLNPNIYNIKVNGNSIENTDYSISGNTISITNSELLRGSFDYIEILHFPNQTDYITDNSITIKLGVYNYDKLFMLDNTLLSDLWTMCIRTEFNSQPNYDFYEIDNRTLKQKEKIKVGINSSLNITTRISEFSEDEKLIQRHLQYYIDNLDKFRIIRVVDGNGTYEYHNNARLINGSNFTEGDVNVYTYTIEFLQRVIISPNTWGEKKWGDFFWGVEKIVLE